MKSNVCWDPCDTGLLLVNSRPSQSSFCILKIPRTFGTLAKSCHWKMLFVVFLVITKSFSFLFSISHCNISNIATQHVWCVFENHVLLF